MGKNDLVFGFLSAFLLVVAGGSALLVTRNHRSTLRFQLILWLAAFAVRFATSVLLYGAGLAETVVGGGDDSGWYGGVVLREMWQAEGIGPFQWPFALLEAYPGQHRGYFYLLAIYFSVTRMPSQLSAAALDCFCGALAIVFTYRTASLLFSEWVATRAAWWTCFFPLMIIWSAQSIKEPVVILLEAVALYACLAIRANGFTTRHVLLATVAIAVLPTLRFYAAYITGAAILMALALPRSRRHKAGIIAALAIGTLVLPLLSQTGALSRHGSNFEEWTDVGRISLFRYGAAHGVGSGSGVESEFDMQTTRGLGLATLDGAAHLLLAPFPWEFRFGSLRMVLTLPEMVVWWLLVIRGLVPGLMHAVRNRLGDVLPLLLCIGGLGLVYSLTFGNIGMIYRQRAQLQPYLLMFAASGLEQRRLRRPSGTRKPVDFRPQPESLPSHAWQSERAPIDDRSEP